MAFDLVMTLFTIPCWICCERTERASAYMLCQVI